MEFKTYARASELQKMIRAKESDLTTLENGILKVRGNMSRTDTKTVFDIKICADQLLSIANYNKQILATELKLLKNEFKNL